MKNFKEIAEKCLAGKLSGTFVFQNGRSITSNKLRKYSKESMHDDYIYYFKGICTLDHYGFGYDASYNIINFIPDNMQEQIKIDIPEGKIPVMEQTEKGVVITWKEKELTYDHIVNEFINNSKFIRNYTRDTYVDNPSSQLFYKKVEVLRKLTNIRNYFGKPEGFTGYIIIQSGVVQVATNYDNSPIFAKKEHAEQAIKMLGDELKYLFEPW